MHGNDVSTKLSGLHAEVLPSAIAAKDEEEAAIARLASPRKLTPTIGPGPSRAAGTTADSCSSFDSLQQPR